MEYRIEKIKEKMTNIKNINIFALISTFTSVSIRIDIATRKNSRSE